MCCRCHPRRPSGVKARGAPARPGNDAFWCSRQGPRCWGERRRSSRRTRPRARVDRILASLRFGKDGVAGGRRARGADAGRHRVWSRRSRSHVAGTVLRASAAWTPARSAARSTEPACECLPCRRPQPRRPGTRVRGAPAGQPVQRADRADPDLFGDSRVHRSCHQKVAGGARPLNGFRSPWRNCVAPGRLRLA